MPMETNCRKGRVRTGVCQAAAGVGKDEGACIHQVVQQTQGCRATAVFPQMELKQGVNLDAVPPW